MLPFGGEGVNRGLPDAQTLTEKLTNGIFTDGQSAIDAYEKTMFADALSLQRGTVQADERIHTQTERVTERVMKIMKEQKALSR